MTKIQSVFVFMVLFAFSVLAEVPPIPEGDPLGTLLSIIQNWGAWSPLMIASAAVVLIVQLMKKFAPEFQYYKLLATVASVVYAILQSIISGLGVVESLIAVLLVSGGAVAIYEVLKGPLNFAFRVKK